MADPRRANSETTARLVALLAVQGEQALFMLPGPVRWRAEAGYTLVPLELPGGAAHDEDSDEVALTREVGARLGADIRLLPTQWTYAPSAHHAIDRRPVPASTRAPLAETQRLALPDSSGRHAAHPVVTRVYRGEVSGTLNPLADAAAIWLAPEAIRAVVRGLALADVLARPDVRWQRCGGDHLPEDSIVYLPSDYGERYLLRAAAKYGAQALFGRGDNRAEGQDASR